MLSNYPVPSSQRFHLLTHIRLTLSFSTLPLRTSAVHRRLIALLSLIHLNPSSPSLQGYFQAQPDLLSEVCACMPPESPSPPSVKTLCCRVMESCVHLREQATFARPSAVLAELGVGKGQYLGLLPGLLRFAAGEAREAGKRGKVEKVSQRPDRKKRERERKERTSTAQRPRVFVRASAVMILTTPKDIRRETRARRT